MSHSADKLKEEYWKSIIQECNQATQNGKMTKTEWLEANNINQATFYRWQQNLRNKVATDMLIQRAQNELVVSNPVTKVEFVEVKPSDNNQVNSTTGATLKYNHVNIELNDSISEELLCKIFKVISNVE